MARPASLPVRLLEPAGDGGPRGMTVQRQNPAYRPTLFPYAAAPRTFRGAALRGVLAAPDRDADRAVISPPDMRTCAPETGHIDILPRAKARIRTQAAYDASPDATRSAACKLARHGSAANTRIAHMYTCIKHDFRVPRSFRKSTEAEQYRAPAAQISSKFKGLVPTPQKSREILTKSRLSP